MYCSQCGKQNPENSRFCTHCGSAIAGGSISVSPPVPAQVEWEYEDFVLDYSKTGMGSRLADSILTATERPEWWARVRSTVMQHLQAWLDQGWQPVASIGPDCLEFREERRREVGGGLALFGVNTYLYLHAVRIQMRRPKAPRPPAGSQADLQELDNAARTQVTKATFDRASKALSALGNAPSGTRPPDILQYYTLVVDIEKFFRKRILDPKTNDFDKAKVQQALSDLKFKELQDVLAAYEPISDMQKTHLSYTYHGLKAWLEDEMLANVLLAARCVKIRVRNEDLTYIKLSFRGNDERINRVLQQVDEREETLKLFKR